MAKGMMHLLFVVTVVLVVAAAAGALPMPDPGVKEHMSAVDKKHLKLKQQLLSAGNLIKNSKNMLAQVK